MADDKPIAETGPITGDALIDAARAYVEASNAHALDRVQAMLASGAEYRSSRVGSHKGVAAIRAMMDGFFADFPDVRWEAAGYRLVGADGVAFDFTMTATAAASGERIERRGVERIFFTPGGLIRRIEVEA